MILIDNYDLTNLNIKVEVSTPYANLAKVTSRIEDKEGGGATDFGSVLHSTELTFNVDIKATNAYDNYRQFMGLFIDKTGKPQKVKMKYKRSPQKYFLCSLSNITELSYVGLYFAKFSFTLISSDGYAINDQIVSTLYPNVGSVSGISYLGDLPTGFKMTLSGTFGNFKARLNDSDGSNQEFVYTAASHSGTLVVDSELYDVAEVGASGLRNASGDFLKLSKTSTSITFTGFITTSVRLEYYPKWLN
ncbi:phage tail family protein [Paenisporosarcina sp. TG-14]|uniref:phage tail family protein n=1 Tax=Paenisporosarcina sp. TG-14 TaxID=1231057 RepID=UPI0002E2A150|nr:phage tail family protein [Paenisporosarcina sp. TG-14]